MKNLTTLLILSIVALSFGACQCAAKKECPASKQCVGMTKCCKKK